MIENSMEVPQKTKNRSSMRSSEPTSEYISKGKLNQHTKEITAVHVYSSIIANR
jgi:hypothetical protein